MRTATTLIMLAVLPALGSSQTTWYVPDDFSTIQGAISDASVVDGDTVIVRPGTYVENIDFLGKGITLQSELGPGVTTIDGNQAGSVVNCSNFEAPDSILDGFTIQNGLASRGGGMSIYGAGPTVRDCVFTGNSATVGGGMSLYHAWGTVTDCTFIGNVATTSTGDVGGGGVRIYYGAPTVTGCDFIQNQARYGGGMENHLNDGSITACSFQGNSADHGGGMYSCDQNGAAGIAPVTDCVFTGNTASLDGGGMCNNGDTIVTNCSLSGNTAGLGGGMFNEPGSAATVINCTFTGNQGGFMGGGMYTYLSSPTLDHCTFNGNSCLAVGAGLYVDGTGTPTVTNCIFWDDSPDEIDGSARAVTYSCVQGGHAGAGNIAQDPLFVDAASGDLHLQRFSPCINRGIDTGRSLTDMDGDPCPTMGTVDMGADEFVGTHPLAADPLQILESTGGVVSFTLDAGGSHANRRYLMFGSITGTAPGLPLPTGAVLPLNWDLFTVLVIKFAASPNQLLPGFAGALDPAGTGTAGLDTNGPLPAGSAGITMSFAYLMFQPPDVVSNPINVEIQ